MSSSNIKEILKLCEEFIPGDPSEFFFDKVVLRSHVKSLYSVSRTQKPLPQSWRCTGRANSTFQTEAEVGLSLEIACSHLAAACAMVMRRDFEYWGIDELDLEPCCALKFYPNIEICNTQIEGDIADKLKEEREKDENFGDGVVGRTR